MITAAMVGLGLLGCAPRPVSVARVGETMVTARDVEFRQAVLALRAGRDVPAHLAVVQLLEEALTAEVGRLHAVVVTDEMLAGEAQRVLATTRDPAMLARIRAVFGGDEAAYRRLVLQPILASQALHARFSLSHDIQAEPLDRAKRLLAAAQGETAPLSALAPRFGGEYRTLEAADGRLRRVGPGVEAMPPELSQDGSAWFDDGREFVEKVLAGLELGGLHPRVVEDRSGFMVVRLLGRSGAGARLEAVVIAKLPFDPWFDAASRRISLTVVDPAMRRALIANVQVPYIVDRLVEAN